MRRRTTLLLAAGLALVLLAGVAYAADIACGMAPCIGTNDADTMTGTTNRNRMDGRGGGDRVVGGKGDDRLRGDGQGDLALDGDDTLKGGAGNDTLVGHAGADTLLGGGGNDAIDADEDARTSGVYGTAVYGIDTVNAGGGNDRIRAVDDTEDYINCGPGASDEVWFDKGGVDKVVNCERKHKQ